MKSNKSVVIVTKYYYPDTSIDAISVLQMVKELRVRDKDLNIHIVTTDNIYKSEEKMNIGNQNENIHRIKSFYNGKNSFTLFLSSILDGYRLIYRARKLSIINIISLTNPPLITLWCSILLRKFKWYYWAFDIYPNALIASKILSKHNLLYKVANYYSYKNAPFAIIGLGMKQYGFLKKQFQKDIIHTILPCGLLKSEDDLNSYYMPEWFDKDKIIIGYIGNIGRGHSIDFVKDAINCMEVEGISKRYKLVLSVYGNHKEEIEEYVKTCIKKNCTITLWEISELVETKFDVSLSDMSIYSILKDLKISRKRVRSKYYPEKIEGEVKFDLDEFYSKLKKYKYDKTICIDETVN
jgi:transposase